MTTWLSHFSVDRALLMVRAELSREELKMFEFFPYGFVSVPIHDTMREYNRQMERDKLALVESVMEQPARDDGRRVRRWDGVCSGLQMNDDGKLEIRAVF